VRAARAALGDGGWRLSGVGRLDGEHKEAEAQLMVGLAGRGAVGVEPATVRRARRKQGTARSSDGGGIGEAAALWPC
jgi:hypothetical protein